MTSYCSSKIGFGPRLSQMTSYHSSKIRLSSLITPYLAAFNVDSNYVITSSPGLKNKNRKRSVSLITQVRKHTKYAHSHKLHAPFFFICNVVAQKRVLSHIKNDARYRKKRTSEWSDKGLRKRQLLSCTMKRGTCVILSTFDFSQHGPSYPTLPSIPCEF